MTRFKTTVPLVAVGLFLVVYLVPQVTGLRINTSTSMPRGVYRSVGGPVTTGAWVSVCLPSEIARFGVERSYLGAGSCPNGSEPVLKVVTAVAGDVGQLTAAGVAVNGELLAHSRPLERDRGGRELAAYAAGPRTLSPGELWLHSPFEERSWDSRYFGPVSAACVNDVVAPLVTFR
jgi:conjugative transfer signal peptidase TraF